MSEKARWNRVYAPLDIGICPGVFLILAAMLLQFLEVSSRNGKIPGVFRKHTQAEKDFSRRKGVYHEDYFTRRKC